MKRKIINPVDLCLVMTMFAACGAEAKRKAKAQNLRKQVVAARGGSHVDVINAVKADFEAENNCTIEVLGLEAADLKQKVSLDSQNQVGAYDLAMADDPWMPEWCEAGLFANLTELGYEPDPDFVKASLDIGKYPYAEGDLFALLLPEMSSCVITRKFWMQRVWPFRKLDDVLKIAKAVNGKVGKVGYVIQRPAGQPHRF
jgi:multiple sugar transport system substrate-binding protein